MDFSIITPSFRSSKWLRLCIPSVADQAGVTFEHIVQDAGSDDGTLDWLLHDPRVKVHVEKDAGMYDAVNRGLRRASGEILAYINCDEQYLPGALKSVKDYFAAHPEVDIVFSDMVVVDTEGDYVCHRKVLLPHRYHSQVVTLPVYTCSMFFRRRLVAERGLYFDAQWRDLGDVAWILKLLDHKVTMGVLRRFTSVFTDTGENMNLKPNAQRENARMRAAAPAWARKSFFLLQLHHRLRRLLRGIYRQEPFDYQIFTPRSPEVRVNKHVARPTFIWRRALLASQ